MKRMKWWKRLSLMVGVLGTALMMTACSTTPKDADKASSKPQQPPVSQSSSRPADEMSKQELKETFIDLQNLFVETIYDSTEELYWSDADVKQNAKDNLSKLARIQKKLKANKTEKALTGKLLELANSIQTFYNNFIAKGDKSGVQQVLGLVAKIGKEEFDGFVAPTVLALTSGRHATHNSDLHPDVKKKESSASGK